MIKRIALALAPFVLAAALPAHAAAQARGIGIGVAGGPVIPTGDFATHAETGFHLLGSFGIGIPLMPIGVRADVIYQQMAYGADDTFTSIGGTLNGTWRLGLPIPMTTPYVLGGLGLTRHDDAHGDHIDPGTETSFTYNVGAGVQLRLLGFGGFIEARYLNWTEGASIPITVGITF